MIELIKTSLNALNYRNIVYRLFFLLVIPISLYGVLPFFSYQAYIAKTDLLKSQDYKFKKKYKIQIIPVLDFIGDMQAAKNLCISANNLGFDCQIFARKRGHNIWIKKKLYEFINNSIVSWTKPDLVLETEPLNYDYVSIKNRNYKSYVILLTSVMSGYMKHQEILGDIQKYYDGFIIYGNDKSWLKDYFPNGLNNVLSDFYLGGPKLKFTQEPRNNLVYSGNSWDSKRSSPHYIEFYNLLDKEDFFEVYGEKRFCKWFKKSYRGLETDPDLYIKNIRKAGISLILHGSYHWKNNEPASARIFEAASVGNLIISDKLPFVIDNFGSSVFYIDTEDPPEQIAQEIKDIVYWARKHPDLANIKAKSSYDIFTEKFTGERMIERIIKFHELIVN